MGNPHPTRSKPFKVGRKHTKAKSIKQKQKERNGKIKRQQQKRSKWRKHKKMVVSYWGGEVNEYPSMEIY